MDGQKVSFNNGSEKPLRCKKIKLNSSKRKILLFKFKIQQQTTHSKELYQADLNQKHQLVNNQERKSKRNLSVTMSISCLERPLSNT